MGGDVNLWSDKKKRRRRTMTAAGSASLLLLVVVTLLASMLAGPGVNASEKESVVAKLKDQYLEAAASPPKVEGCERDCGGDGSKIKASALRDARSEGDDDESINADDAGKKEMEADSSELRARYLRFPHDQPLPRGGAGFRRGNTSPLGPNPSGFRRPGGGPTGFRPPPNGGGGRRVNQGGRLNSAGFPPRLRPQQRLPGGSLDLNNRGPGSRPSLRNRPLRPPLLTERDFIEPIPELRPRVRNRPPPVEPFFDDDDDDDLMIFEAPKPKRRNLQTSRRLDAPGIVGLSRRKGGGPDPEGLLDGPLVSIDDLLTRDIIIPKSNRRVDDGEDQVVVRPKRISVSPGSTNGHANRSPSPQASKKKKTDLGLIKPSESSYGYDYHQWESRKVGKERLPFKPVVLPEEGDIPRPSRTAVASTTPRSRTRVTDNRPFRPKLPRRVEEAKTRQNGPSPGPPPSKSQPDSSKVNLRTEYFSLPSSLRPTPLPHDRREEERKPSRIPVLVKKLAKRPVVRTPSPKVSRNSTDICANSDIDCGGGGNGGNVTRSADVAEAGVPKKLLDFLRGEVWVIPVLVSALALSAVLLVFEIYLISKAIASTPSRRHLLLGQTLMLGLALCCASAVVLCLKPSPVLCSVARIGTGLSYTVVYSTLLVKLVFLISLNSGVYLPATYQSLLLCFAVLIQLVIGIQWLVSSPARVLHLTLESGEVFSACDVTFRQQILGLLYVVFLVAVVIVLAFKSRGVRENYREAMYIGLTMFFTVCIFSLWIVGGFLGPAAYGDLCLSSGLVASSAITFVIMFMPKGRQLSAMGRDGLYTQDRAEMYGGGGDGEGSSTQSTGSTGGTPSPSFFPIKPGKFHHNHHRDRLDTPPSPRKQGTTSTLTSLEKDVDDALMFTSMESNAGDAVDAVEKDKEGVKGGGGLFMNMLGVGGGGARSGSRAESCSKKSESNPNVTFKRPAGLLY